MIRHNTHTVLVCPVGPWSLFPESGLNSPVVSTRLLCGRFDSRPFSLCPFVILHRKTPPLEAPPCPYAHLSYGKGRGEKYFRHEIVPERRDTRRTPVSDKIFLKIKEGDRRNLWIGSRTLYSSVLLKNNLLTSHDSSRLYSVRSQIYTQ